MSDVCKNNCQFYSKGVLFAGWCNKYNVPLMASTNPVHVGLVFKCAECRKGGKPHEV